MQSTKLGLLFEKATFCILKDVFKCWGYDITNSKIQRSGTQYGFDLYFRIVKGLVVHNMFIECKASNSFNKIKQAELNDKTAQLSWANFPRKDFHIFFSPTRAVDYNNQQLGIEDNDWPFVIVDCKSGDTLLNVTSLCKVSPDLHFSSANLAKGIDAVNRTRWAAISEIIS